MSTNRVLSTLVVACLVLLAVGVGPRIADSYQPASGATSLDQSPAAAAPTAAYTGYYTLLGYEGIGTLGSGLTAAGPVPPVGDYVSTHCRYIDVQNTTVGHYYLRYPLHLPNGATITGVEAHVADFNPTGVMFIYLRSRSWNSRDAGWTEDWTLTDNATNSDKTVNMGTVNVTVNNQTTTYWIDVSPQNSTSPGQLCVYGIRVTYTLSGVYLAFIAK